LRVIVLIQLLLKLRIRHSPWTFILKFTLNPGHLRLLFLNELLMVQIDMGHFPLHNFLQL
jgi:hypothetical protein